jgi:hypothetical protein
MLGGGTGEDPGRARCTIASTAADRAGICSNGTLPTFSSEDETLETPSLVLIALPI